jgi:hypothetical protein
LSLPSRSRWPHSVSTLVRLRCCRWPLVEVPALIGPGNVAFWFRRPCESTLLCLASRNRLRTTHRNIGRDLCGFGNRGSRLSHILRSHLRLRMKRCSSFELLRPLQPKHSIFQARRKIVQLSYVLLVGAALAHQPNNNGPKNQHQKEFHKQCANEYPMEGAISGQFFGCFGRLSSHSVGCERGNLLRATQL